MLKRPQWVKEKIDGREKNIPLQMTVKKKYTQQSPYANMPTMSTGSGVDGTVQPGKMVDVQVHEGEGIIPNNAMQGITDDEFKGLVDTLSSGNIDKNKFRESINMPTVSEYQTGGRVIDYTTDKQAADVLPNVGYKYADQEKTDATKTTTPTTTSMAPVAAPTRQSIQAPVTKVATTQPETVQTETVTRPQPAYEFKPPQEMTQPEVQTPPPPEQPPQPPPAQAPQPPQAEAQTETVTQPVVSPAGEMVRQGLQNILAEAQGVSDVDRKIANFYLQNTDASNAANLRVLESQISSDPEMSDQAKRAAIAGLQREAQAQRSQMTGELAINAAERASAASRDLVTYGGQVRSYEEITLPQARQNLEIQRRTFDEITKPMSDLQIQQLESELGTQNWNEIQDMINKGMTIDRVNEKLAEKNIRPLSIGEYTGMLDAGSLGERNWNRQMAAANTLLATPGENNKTAAAEMLSNLYGGVDFDFSKLITQENAETFSQGLSQMASYVAAGMDVDTAMEAMKADETLTMMGIDEGQLAQMYNATKVNALDAEWEAIEGSQIYQSLLNSSDPADREKAAAIKEFNTMAKLGMLDYDTLHEYKITGPDGVSKGSVYAKTPEDAQTQADGYGVGYTVQDTGNIDFAIKEPPETELEGEAAGLKGKWEKFQKSIPSEVVINQDLYKRWESWQENNTGDYNDFLKTETPANKLQSIEVGTNKELLDKNNSEIIFDSFEQTPEKLKESGYYFQYPDKKYLEENITAGKKSGKNVTKMSTALESTFDNAEGKIVELPDGTVGQVVSAENTPTTVQLKVKQKDGTYKNYVVFQRFKGVNYASS